MEGTPIIPLPLYMPRGDIPLGDMPLGATPGCEALCVKLRFSSDVKMACFTLWDTGQTMFIKHII